MDRYTVCSDIHGDLEALENMIEKAKGTTMIICGDLCPGGYLWSLLPAGTILVRGNCDSSYMFDFSGLRLPPLYRIENIFGKKTYIHHGHMSLQIHDADMVISGHTHVPNLERTTEGTIYLNPGSVSRPRGRDGKTYAIIDEYGIRILDYDFGDVIKELKF